MDYILQTAVKKSNSITRVKSLIDSHRDLNELVTGRINIYLLKALNMVLNELIVSYGELKKMTETELDAFIKN